MPESHPKVNGWYRLTALLAAAFVVTILMMVAAALTDSRPGIIRFFNDHGLTLLAVEVAAILTTGFLAMAADRSTADAPPPSGEANSEIRR